MAIDYGSDISTFYGPAQDLDPTFAVMSGPRVLGEAVARRLQTPANGGLFYDLTYGFDLRSLLSDNIDASKAASLAAAVESEALKDERVRSCTCTVTPNPLTSAVSIRLLITGDQGPFTLTLQASALTLQIITFG